MEIRKAKIEELENIFYIYKSLIGESGCTWNQYYPSINDIKNDINQKALSIMVDEAKIVGAVCACKDEEVMEFDCWNKEFKNPYVLCRVGVLKEYQHKGISKELIKYAENDVLNKKCDVMYLTVGKINQKAINLYEKLDYKCCGEVTLYEQDWFCYEKELK